jgi:hypothetical protein
MARPRVNQLSSESFELDTESIVAEVATPAPAPVSKPKAVAAPVKELKPKIYHIPSGGGIIYTIKSEAIIYDPNTNTNRQIRYCPNEPSVFADEQSSFAVRQHVIFENGMLYVPIENPTLQRFLDLHPGNRANGGGIFEEVNTERNAQVDVDSEFILHDAIGLVRNKSVDELLPVAIYLGIDTNQKNAEIKRELLLEAKANPKKFIELFDNPVVQARAAVKNAINYQILKERPDGMYWFDSGRLIVSTPAGQDTVEVMSRFCLSEKGSILYNELKEQLEKL